MSVFSRLQRLARAQLLDLTEKTRDIVRSSKPSDEMTDDELEEEILRRRRERAARKPGDPAPEVEVDIAQKPKNKRSPQEQQLAQYYMNLELPVGAPLDDVRRAYKEMMRKYHPDKHVGDPARHQAATELAQSLTRAYRALLEHAGEK